MRVYATVPGAEVRISHYGTATCDLPCLVPTAVAKELAHVAGFRVEPDEPDEPTRAKKHHSVKE